MLRAAAHSPSGLFRTHSPQILTRLSDTIPTRDSRIIANHVGQAERFDREMKRREAIREAEKREAWTQSEAEAEERSGLS